MSVIDERYIDAFGVERIVPNTTRAAFAALLEAHAAPERIIPATIVVREGESGALVTTLPAGSWTERITWTVALEDTTVQRGSAELRDAPVIDSFERENRIMDRRTIALPILPLGYHRISVDAGAYGATESTLIVVPQSAYRGPQERSWGLAVQLYTVRSARNWGIGDLTDLHAIIALADEIGATYVGLNPLHAPHRSDPDAASPYAPTSRRFLNWLAIDVEAIPEATDPTIRAAIDDPEFAGQLARLRAAANVDYNGVAECKDAILRRCFALARQRLAHDKDYAAFLADGGIALIRFATFETLVERLGRDLAAWPATYRDPTTDDVRAFAAAERHAIDYAMYLQYEAARQLASAAAAGAARGIRLYRDLAVGVDSNGADVWIDPQAFVSSVSVGAPPDALNPIGQDWGLPPLDPNRLASDGYRIISELFRANMRDAGALRVDHAMSLARLFWSPRGRPASEGTYVRYPLEDLMGVLALESVRAACVVVGEDLGTVPPGFRERMAAGNVLSYRILFFERDVNGGFITPERYPALALAATGTHDLPPFAAWFAGSDVELRATLGIVDPARLPAERAARDADRDRLIAALVQSGDLADPAAPWAGVMVAAYQFLARSPARIVMMQIDDAIGETQPVNVPGTWDQYPNWRRKLALELDHIAADPAFSNLCAALRAERPRIERELLP